MHVSGPDHVVTSLSRRGYGRRRTATFTLIKRRLLGSGWRKSSSSTAHPVGKGKSRTKAVHTASLAVRKCLDSETLLGGKTETVRPANRIKETLTRTMKQSNRTAHDTALTIADQEFNGMSSIDGHQGCSQDNSFKPTIIAWHEYVQLDARRAIAPLLCLSWRDTCRYIEPGNQ